MREKRGKENIVQLPIAIIKSKKELREKKENIAQLKNENKKIMEIKNKTILCNEKNYNQMR